MKYFIDTHDRAKGSFPGQVVTEEEFFAQFDSLEKAGEELRVIGHAAHVNLEEGKAFCFMSGPTKSPFGRLTPPSIFLTTRSPKSSE